MPRCTRRDTQLLCVVFAFRSLVNNEERYRRSHVSFRNLYHSHADHEILLNDQFSFKFSILQYCPQNYYWLNITCMHLFKVSRYHLLQMGRIFGCAIAINPKTNFTVIGMILSHSWEYFRNPQMVNMVKVNRFPHVSRCYA